MLQQYEAGHTLHGKWSLPAYQQIASELATALQEGAVLDSEIQYDDWRGKAVGKPLPGTTADSLRQRPQYGKPLLAPKPQYAPGETVAAEFLSANPIAHYTIGNNFLLVERRNAAGWQPVVADGDWSTRVHWRAKGDVYIAELSWDIPEDTRAGEYRISHSGYDPDGGIFNGISEIFLIER